MVDNKFLHVYNQSHVRNTTVFLQRRAKRKLFYSASWIIHFGGQTVMKTFTTKRLCQIAVFTAVIIVVSQLSIPLPGGVPMTLQTFIIPLAGLILGAVDGTISTVIYLLLGAVGLPVFAGFKGGIGSLLGMTGGFLISFPIMPLLAGIGDILGRKLEKKGASRAVYYTALVIFLTLGALLNYLVGTIWFAQMTGSTLAYAFTACVLPFIPTAIIKIVLDAVIGPVLKKAMIRARIITPAAA